MAKYISVSFLKKVLHIDGSNINESQTIDLKILGEVVANLRIKQKIPWKWCGAKNVSTMDGNKNLATGKHNLFANYIKDLL